MPSQLPARNTIFTLPLTPQVFKCHSQLPLRIGDDFPMMDYLSCQCELFFERPNSLAFRVMENFFGTIICDVFCGNTLPQEAYRIAKRFGVTREQMDRAFARRRGFLPAGWVFPVHWTLNACFSFARPTHMRIVPRDNPFVIEVRPNAYLKLEKSPAQIRLENQRPRRVS